MKKKVIYSGTSQLQHHSGPKIYVFKQRCRCSEVFKAVKSTCCDFRRAIEHRPYGNTNQIMTFMSFSTWAFPLFTWAQCLTYSYSALHMRHLIKLPLSMQIHVKFPLLRDATTRADLALLRWSGHLVRSFINRYSLTDLQWINRLK